MIKALLFDFDGTILDTETCDYEAWRAVFKSYGLELTLTEWAEGFHGARGDFNPYSELEARLGTSIPARILTHQHQIHESNCIQSQPLLPGISTYLAEAKQLGIPTAVVSSDTRTWIFSHLIRFNMEDDFATVCCADDHVKLKPAPDLYLAALERLGAAAQEAVAFEDSPNGIRAAKAAGVFCVAIANPVTKLLKLDEADIQVESLAALPLAQLRELLRGKTNAN